MAIRDPTPNLAQPEGPIEEEVQAVDQVDEFTPPKEVEEGSRTLDQADTDYESSMEMHSGGHEGELEAQSDNRTYLRSPSKETERRYALRNRRPPKHLDDYSLDDPFHEAARQYPRARK